MTIPYSNNKKTSEDRLINRDNPTARHRPQVYFGLSEYLFRHSGTLVFSKFYQKFKHHLFLPAIELEESEAMKALLPFLRDPEVFRRQLKSEGFFVHRKG